MPKHPINGWINLYKPKGMTSTQAVGAVKRLLRPAKIGHAGTLDPLAEGVLPLALGEATKTVPYMMDATKTYVFTVTWGQERSTGDAEGEVIASSNVRPSEAEIIAILPRFTGVISQVPPAYSAIKVNGERAYDLARAGQDVELRAREVTIFSLKTCPHPNPLPLGEGTRINLSQWERSKSAETISGEGYTTFTVQCSKGTYVRSLAVDMARALGTVGYVSYLKRAAVGRFDEASTISLDFLEEFVHKTPSFEQIVQSEWLLPLSDALDDIPALVIDAAAMSALRKGQPISDTSPSEATELAAYCDGKLVAIVSRQAGRLAPKRVFNL